MNFNQLTAAAAAAAAGNPNNNLSMSSFTTAVTNILANSNIDLSQLANISPHLPAFSAALELRRNRDQQQHQQSSRQNLHQAHRSTGANHPNPNSLVDLPSSMSNLQSADAAAAAAAAAAAVSVAGLPASISNLTSSALADLAANAAAAATAAHQPQAHSGRSASIQSAHHRSSNHHNHHSTNQLTAAHQSTSAANKAANLAAHQHHHQSQQHHHHHQHQNTIHHRHSTSSHHNSLSNHNHSINNINNHSSNNLSNNSIIMNNSTNSLLNSSNTPTSTATIIATNNTNSITPPKDSTCYRIGDCVYFEPTTSSPPTLPSPQQYQIGRIDEICKTPNTTTTANTGDNIEVKVVVFFRRRDISSSLMTLADKYQYDETQEEEIKSMSEKDKNLLKQRELFYSRQIETIPATSIKGKCTVQLLNESESFTSYLNKDDHYFYTLVYDPQQKTITADRGEIRVGQRYQAEVQPSSIYTPQPGGSPDDPRDLSELETLVYTPDHNLTDDDINKFLTIAKSVGTFARALDCSSSIKQPSLHLTAASASRDVTLLYAMQLLHQNNYDLGKAVCALVPSTGPVLCRDEIEEWTSGEAALFEEAIEKYGREFGDIRHDFVSINFSFFLLYLFLKSSYVHCNLSLHIRQI